MSKYGFMKGVVMLLISTHLTGCSTLFGRHQDEQLVYFDSNTSEVEIICEGEKEAIESFLNTIKECQLGPHIKKCNCHWEKATGEFSEFRVEFCI